MIRVESDGAHYANLRRELTRDREHLAPELVAVALREVERIPALRDALAALTTTERYYLEHDLVDALRQHL